MRRRSRRRHLRGDGGASTVEYSLAVVLIGLAAVLALGFVGKATSDTFDEVGTAFTNSSPGDPAADAAFDDLLAVVGSVGTPGDSLLTKADEAKSRYLMGDTAGALGKLDSLVNEVNALEGNTLTAEEADAVRSAVQEVVDQIG